MLKLAVVGKDVSKSDSAKMHTFDLKKMGVDCEYSLISLTKEEFDARVESLLNELDALNVTIPYKLDVIPHLKKLEGDAKTFGAVNVVKDRIGYNTDGVGFLLMLQNNEIDVKGKDVLVLGAGGAGRSVVKKLLDEGAKVTVFDVRKKSALELNKEFGGITVADEVKPQPRFMIVNVTGVGMHKTEGISPVGADVLSQCEIACDLIYYPRKSEFLRIAESLGKRIVNGEGMLFYQAYYGDCIVLNRKPSAEEAKRFFEEYLLEYPD